MEIDAPEDEQVEVKPKPPLNDFTVKKTLGKGAFASVYKVTQMSTLTLALTLTLIGCTR